jgi:thioredoxin reductase
MTDNKNFDVIIVGGSYAGLSAAMSLGRALRNVLIIDSGLPCNRQTPHSHNFITQDGEKPGVIAEKAKKQVLKYDTVKFLTDLAVNGTKTDNGFEISTQSGKLFSANKGVKTTGTYIQYKKFEFCTDTQICLAAYKTRNSIDVNSRSIQ